MLMTNQKSPPLVTILVPTIGRRKYIVDTVNSILSQSYPYIQIIISDNSVNDSTSNVLGEAGIKDSRIEFLVQNKFLDYGEHLNKCLPSCRGSYVMVLSDDDLISPTYIESMVRVIQHYPNVVVCIGHQESIGIDFQDNVIKTKAPISNMLYDGVDFLKQLHSGELPKKLLSSVSIFHKVEDLNLMGGYKDYPDGSHVPNYTLFNLALQGDVAIISDLMLYRIYTESVGLKTPFEALLKATRMYTQDCISLLRGWEKLGNRDIDLLYKYLITNNTKLLLSRLRNVYYHRMSLVSLINSTFKVCSYALNRWSY